MKNWKKNIVSIAVLLTVCAGIYVNWMYTEDYTTVDFVDTLDENKILSTDMLVMGGENANIENTGNNTLSEYFAAVRLSRQEARDSAVALLQEAMAYSDSAAAAQSSEQLQELVQTALCEAQIESLIIAKGYADCVAYIANDQISVAVAAPEGGLQDTDVALIADVVISQSEFSMVDIRVVEVP